MSVESTHPDYDKMLPEWQLVKACSAGQREVKRLKTKLLPAPGAKQTESTITYDSVRYSRYLTRAIYTNVTGRTKQGLAGAAFRVPPVIDLPEGLKYLEDNADGAGQSLTQLAKDIFSSLLDDGRQILVTDYPSVEEGLTQEQVTALDPKAMIKRYDAVNFINWDSDTINGSEAITLGVLKEEYNASTDEFSHNQQDQYRVLRYKDGIYTQQLYRGTDVSEEIEIKDASGANFSNMTLFPVGAQNNDLSVDEIPLADIAHVNVGHYRNSADLEESAFIAGQATLHIDMGEMDNAEWLEANPTGQIAIGSEASIQTRKGKVELVQSKEVNIYTKLMEDKQAQMLSLGAKLVEQRNPNETAAAARIDATGENSVLSDLVTNVEEGIQRCIEWCGQFMGVEVDGKAAFKMNRQFFDDTLDPTTLSAVIQGYQGALLPRRIALQAYQKAGFIGADEDIELVVAEVDSDNPLTTTPVQNEQ